MLEAWVMGKLFLLFAGLPLLDLFVLFKLGKAVGGSAVVLYVMVVGLCGAWLMRATGVRVVGAWRRAFAEGRPADEGAVAGGLQFLACALLIMPGVITDVLGLSLFVPQVRRAIARRVNRGIREAIERGTLHVAHASAQGGGVHRAPIRPSVIDVDGEVVEAHEEPPKRLNG